jgi:hypothetical protein
MVWVLQRAYKMFVLTMAAHNLIRCEPCDNSLLKHRNKAETMKGTTPMKYPIRRQRAQWNTDSLYIKRQSSGCRAYQRLIPDFSAAC